MKFFVRDDWGPEAYKKIIIDAYGSRYCSVPLGCLESGDAVELLERTMAYHPFAGADDYCLCDTPLGKAYIPLSSLMHPLK